MSDRPKLWIQHKEALIAASLFLGALGFYSLDWFYSLSNGWYHLYDGVSTVGAERVLAGEIPYRDFWTMYAPGHFYLLAFLFRVFGTHLLVEVVAASMVCAAAAVACYWFIVSMTGRRLLGLACAGIFVAAIYNTEYYKRLGSYPPAILSILVALSLLTLYYKLGKIGHLVSAGLVTGAAIVFKHDIGGYTAIAVVAGLTVYHLLGTGPMGGRARTLLRNVGAYSAGIAAIVLPPLIFFAIAAGPDMVQDLLVFPLTDFRFARPEGYPSLLPTRIYDESPVMMLKNLGNYVSFTIPFVLFLVGLVATGLAVRRRRLKYAALGATFAVAFLLHYVAAHVQINTHIVTMSVYAICMGAIFDHVTERRYALGRPILANLFILVLVIGWLLSLLFWPAYMAGWAGRKQATVELELARVSGFRVLPREARALTELAAFVDAHVPEDEELFVGAHRHDIVIIGDKLIYFILDRPNATRYQELHPAITDTADVQQEIIKDLIGNDVSTIVLKHIFEDDYLDKTKRDFLENLPNIGATDLDDFIRQNYTKVQEFGPYEARQRKGVSGLSKSDR